MSRQTMSIISIIPLVLGSILLFGAGAGLISTKYFLTAGLVCFMVFAFFEGLSRRKTGKTSDQQYKSHKNIKHKKKKSVA